MDRVPEVCGKPYLTRLARVMPILMKAQEYPTAYKFVPP
jgi:hypothetical protein